MLAARLCLRFVESVGSSFNQVEFARASDPSVGALNNPWSDWHDDAKLLRLAGPEVCIVNREEFNEGRYVWYALGRRAEHRVANVRPFIGLGEIEARRVAAEAEHGSTIANIPLNQATPCAATVTYAGESGLHVSTTVNNFHYAIVFPEIVRDETRPIPNRLIFEGNIARGGFAIGLLDPAENCFFYNCTIWRDGVVRGSRDLGDVQWPKRFQVVVSNYQPGLPAASEWRLSRIALQAVHVA